MTHEQTRPRTRYADPALCPDCRAPLLRGGAPRPDRCPSCGLLLAGPDARSLFAALSHADALLTRLRLPVPAPLAPVPPVAPPRPGAVPPLPTYPAQRAHPAQPPAPEHRVLPAMGVPAVLLGLGALCLLVAALFFITISWLVFGVAGRTLILAVLTSGAGALAWVTTRHRLRGAAEALTAVALGFWACDLLGAAALGLVGDVGAGDTALLVGVGLAVVANAAAESARLSRVGGLVVPEAAAVLGLLVAFLGALAAFPLDAALVGSTVLLLAATALAVVRRHHVLAVGAAGLTLLAGGIQGLAALGRAVAHAAPDELWGDLEAWPLLASVLLLLATAGALRLVGDRALPSLRTVLHHARTVLVAAAAVVLVGLAVLALHEVSVTLAWSTWLVVAALAGALGLVVTPRWRPVPRSVLVAALVVPGVLAVAVVLAAASRLVPDRVLGEPLGATLPRATADWRTVLELAQPWLVLPTLVVTALALLVATPRATASPAALVGRVARWTGPLVALVLLALAAVSAAYDVPRLVPVLPGLLAGAALGAWVLLTRAHGAWVPVALAVVGAVVVAATPSTALLLTGLAVLLALAVAGERAGTVAASAGRLVAPAALAALVAVVGHLAGLAAVALPTPVLLALVALAAVRRSVLVDVAGGATALLVLLLGFTATAGGSTDGWDAGGSPADWLAVDLTLAGAGLALLALLDRQRRAYGWGGTALLALASWVRLVDQGVTVPEAYTLPLALVLLAVGTLRLVRDRSASTTTLLTPGLVLAALPSTLWVLVDPEPARTTLLALGALSAVLLGAGLRWSAPLVVGGATLALVALRITVPYVDLVPPWVVVGLAGAVLTALGVTWEAQVRGLRGGVQRLQQMR